MYTKYLSKDSPANIYLLKVNNRNTKKRHEICSKLTIKTPERRHFEQVNVSWEIVNGSRALNETIFILQEMFKMHNKTLD